ncbi:hypothetical protein BN134_831 [Cronobacter dublinensis 1210]|uniref:Transposase n=1 Tax=Cronobacter dublinensis 1210 TaxID=1208656 RepID=A0ABM9Q3Z4_9ENTR|nr:hypothetical protein BN134_831 [Cronobacter dublinensis 1210]
MHFHYVIEAKTIPLKALSRQQTRRMVNGFTGAWHAENGVCDIKKGGHASVSAFLWVMG